MADLGFRVDSTGLLRAERRLDSLEGSSRRVGVAGERAGGLLNRSMRNSAGGIGAATANMNLLRGAIAGLGFGSAIRTSRNFEAAMNDVEEKLNATSSEMELVRTTASQMGASTAFSASQAGEAMSSLAQRGLEAGETVQILPDILNLASASQISLARSSEITTDAMAQFGLGIEESTRVVDLLAGVGDSSGTTIEQLAAALTKAGPRAREFGVSLEETAAMVGILANNGVRAEVAGTGLSAMISRLVKPVGEGKKALEELGLSAADFINVSEDGQESFIGYANAIDLIRSTGVTATQLIRVLGEEAGKSVAPAFNEGAAAVRNMQSSFDDASSAQAQALTQMKGLPGAMKAVASAWEAVNLALVGSEGANLLSTGLNALADGMRNLATDVIPGMQPALAALTRRFAAARLMFVEFIEAMRSSDSLPFVALRQVGGLIASIGTALAPVTPYIDDMVVAMAGIAAGSAAFSVLAGAVGLLSSPLVLIAAFAVSVNQIYQNWDGVVEWWSGIWSEIQSSTSDFMAWWRDTEFDQKLLDVGTLVIESARGAASSFFDWWDSSTLKTITPQIIIDGIDSARAAGNRFLDWWDGTTFEDKVTDIQYAAVDFARNAWNSFFVDWDTSTLEQKTASVGAGSIQAVSVLAREFVDWWQATTLREYLPTVLTSSIDSAIERIQLLAQWWTTTNFQEKIADITFETITRAYEAILRFRDFWQELDLKSIILDFEFPSFGDLSSAGSGLLSRMTEFGGQVVAGFGNGISRATDHIEAIEGTKSDIELAVATMPSDMANVGSDTAAGLANGLSSGASSVLDAAGSMSSGVLERFRAIFQTRSPSKETERIGLDVAAGLALGINNGAQDAVAAAQSLSTGVLGSFSGGGAANDPFSFASNVVQPGQFAQSDPVIRAAEMHRQIETGYTAHVASMAQTGDLQVANEQKRWSDLSSIQQAGYASSIANNFIDAFKKDVGSYIALNDNMTAAERAQAQASNAINRKRFEDNKKANIAQAIISTLTGATNALSQVPFPANFAAAAAITAAGFRNIANIRSSSYGGGSVGSSTGSGSITSTPAPVAPVSTQNQQPQGIVERTVILSGDFADEDEVIARAARVQRRVYEDGYIQTNPDGTPDFDNVPEKVVRLSA